MITRIISVLSVFIIGVISSGGYLGIVALMAIESACIPLPSEVIMPFSGYLVYTGRFHLLWVATAGAIGCNLGSVIASTRSAPYTPPSGRSMSECAARQPSCQSC